MSKYLKIRSNFNILTMNKTLLFINFCSSSNDFTLKLIRPCFKRFCVNFPRSLVTMSGESACAPLVEDFKNWALEGNPKYAQLPVDIITENYVRESVKNAVFSTVLPSPLERNVRLVVASTDALENILDLSPKVAESEEFLAFMSGNKLPAGANPVAHRYGGHQFGYWAGQLGDGRALLVGEYVNRSGKKWELQLKGSGPTPYSRQGDGRAVLRSSIREMVASEAFHYLGIPTTRAAALIVSDDPVMRDIFYCGHPICEKAAVVLRLSPSWFRIGSLEILARSGELQLMRQICDYIIQEHFPDISLQDENRLIRLFTVVAHRSLNLVAKWQGFAFTHGVLNTDNISLLGLTIDFGPYGFADSYYSGFVPNHSDGEGRYALGKQLEVVCWNLAQLSTAISPILTSAQKVQIANIVKCLDNFGKNRILKIFITKLGLKTEQQGDDIIVEKLLEMMQDTGADFTLTFWQLSEVDPSEYLREAKLEDKWALKRLTSHESWPTWVDMYKNRLTKVVDSDCSPTTEDERRRIMKAVNPRYVPRNWMLQDAITAAEKDDFSKVRFLMEVLKKPFEINQEAEKVGYASEPPTWAQRLKLSCSS